MFPNRLLALVVWNIVLMGVFVYVLITMPNLSISDVDLLFSLYLVIALASFGLYLFLWVRSRRGLRSGLS